MKNKKRLVCIFVILLISFIHMEELNKNLEYKAEDPEIIIESKR